MTTERRRFLKAVGGVSVVGMTGLAGCTGNRGGGGNGGGDGQSSDVTEWSISGSQQGSPANTWVQAYAETVKKHSKTLRLSPTLQPGWQRAVVKISKGEHDTGVSWSHYVYQSQNDLEYFSEGGAIGPLKNKVVQIFPIQHLGHWWLTTYADRNDIQTVKDLKGKSVGLNLRGESPTKWAKAVLKAAGVLDTLQVSYLNFPDSGRAIRNRTIDAALVLAINGAVLPAPHVEAFASVDMKDVGIPEEVQKKTKENNPVIQFSTIKNANLNQKGTFETADTMLQVSSVHTNANKPKDLVNEMVSTVIDNQDELGQYHPVLKSVFLGEKTHNFTGVLDGTEFHPGAVEYFSEKKDLVPDDVSFEGNVIRRS